MLQRDERSELHHHFKNHLAIITGFCDLLLLDLPQADRNHAAVQEIRRAAHASLALLPKVFPREEQGQ